LSQSDAQQYLKVLCSGYQQGMSRPLLLLHKSGWAWLQHCFNSKTGKICWDEKVQNQARAKLLQIWQGNINKGISGEA
ncbi:MAG: hypothetical protein K7J15_04875, partial [Candidatus Regiella insecticola]|nr:hypothetical protein [Candidatus Regiella insecticola]